MTTRDRLGQHEPRLAERVGLEPETSVLKRLKDLSLSYVYIRPYSHMILMVIREL